MSNNLERTEKYHLFSDEDDVEAEDSSGRTQRVGGQLKLQILLNWIFMLFFVLSFILNMVLLLQPTPTENEHGSKWGKLCWQLLEKQLFTTNLCLSWHSEFGIQHSYAHLQ